MLKSVPAPSVVVAKAVSSRLIGSARVEDTTAVLLIVPLAPLLTFTTRLKPAALLTATMLLVQTIFPVPPTDGELRSVQPAGVLAETKVVFTGVASLRLTAVAV